MRRDFGEIGRFPLAVEGALFFLLLARWEEWSTMPEVDWRGFRVPWIYTLDDDLFVRLTRPPSADSLTLEPWIVEDNWGEEVELEQPSTLPLHDSAKTELQRLTERRLGGVAGRACKFILRDASGALPGSRLPRRRNR